MNLQKAEEIAERVVNDIKPFCLRVEVAGSVRRKKLDDIKDLEIVAFPNNKFLLELRAVVNNKYGPPQAGAFPSKYTKIRGLYPIDFFWANQNNWGMIYFIRTGSADFVKRALGHWKKISKGGSCSEGILYDGDGMMVPTYEEIDVFKALKTGFIQPEKRK